MGKPKDQPRMKRLPHPGRPNVAAKTHDAILRAKGRLPGGSVFRVEYDGSNQRWFGALTVPTAAGPVTFTGVRGGVFRLLHLLDDQYRASLEPAADGAAAKGGAS